MNCTSSQTLLDKMDRTKIEIADGEIYQVFVKYLNIEGEPCVLEILKDITNLNIDPCDLKEIGAKFLTEDSGIYKDLATGVLNRQFFEKRERQ